MDLWRPLTKREATNDGVTLDNAVPARGRHRPTVRAAVLVEPGSDLSVPLTEAARRDSILMRTGKRRSAAVIISRGLPGV